MRSGAARAPRNSSGARSRLPMRRIGDLLPPPHPAGDTPMPKITSLEDAFIHELSDIYSAEKQLTKALPKLARAASSSSLAGGFTTHADETQGQVERIDQIVEDLGIKLKR